jgi:CDP-2,3-bis-(O-geranylgeranyl)-sn-glycerol synthase
VKDILFALWFFLPAGLSNAAPVFAARIPLISHLTQPLDFGKTYRGHRIFGANKTWRGLITGTLVGVVTALLVYPLFFGGTLDLSFWLSTILVGGVLGFGALFGDAIESFFKRQLNVKPGHSWFPFDQIDYILGAFLISFPVVHLPLSYYGIILVTWFAMHLIASYIGYLLGLKDRPI